MVSSPEEYSYSSAYYYVIGSADDLVTEDPLYAGFGTNTHTRREEYWKFLLSFDAEERKRYTHCDIPLGDANFRCRLVRHKGHHIPRRKGKALRAKALSALFL